MTGLGLTFAGVNRVQLTDGSEAALDGYAVTVLWDSRARRVVAYVSDAAPLVGMALPAGHSMCVDIEAGGRVSIEATA